MKYLNSKDIDTIGTDWRSLINVIGDAVGALKECDFAQPIKPYLRYRDLRNRIIAMPAYVGGRSPLAGIKWVASFPANIDRGLPRAHSVTVLNDPTSGMPLCVVNTSMVSAIRTAAVSGLMVDHFRKIAKRSHYTIGIVGFGPIGRMHLKMLETILGDLIGKVLLFDIRGIEVEGIETGMRGKIEACRSWQDCYRDADIFITCTVAEKPYINTAPKKGSLQLNISLRDFEAGTRQFMDHIVVDEWNEVCRENTDIENMYKGCFLKQEDVLSMPEFLLDGRPDEEWRDSVIMFNPMGMAVFDVAIGGYYYEKSVEENIGLTLPE